MKRLIYITQFALYITYCVSTTVNAQSRKQVPSQKTQHKLVSTKTLKSSWFKTYDFNASSFKMPLASFGPLTRWWWPGNDVEDKELQREIALFANMGFAGVEIQPFSQGLNLKGPDEQLKRQLSWDSPSFYAHLRTVMKTARQHKMIVDLNAGSGWPMGGPSIKPEESLLTLAHADTLIEGGQIISFLIPQLRQENFTVRPSSFQLTQTVSVKYARLQTVLAARIISSEKKPVVLEPATIQKLAPLVSGNTISWNVPSGKWIVMAFWSIPDGELPKTIASQKKGYITDYLDSAKLNTTYNYLFGPRTGLQPYYGNPFRSVFNDSYEFMTDRHYTENFLNFFNQQRGYDLTPYLPVNMKKYYNNAYLAPMMANNPFDFSYSPEDWRIRYDYDVTISELFINQSIKPSNYWLGKRGLLHRTQAYGLRMDIIGGSGAADIPETEQLAGGNSEGFVKLVTSGAHLYNKPLVTQESFVFSGMAEMMTPQKIKLLADKSFSAGVNQIIYHGTPYKYQTGEFGREGWTPFSSPFSPGLTFSSTFNESFPFWQDIKTVNRYIARSQYILQAGKARADVLIYVPFNNIIPEQITPNPFETLKRGLQENIDPQFSSGAGDKEQIDKTEKWFKELWPLVNQLEASGITWDFVNDAALQQSSLHQNRIWIGSNQYQTLIVANAPFINLASAQKIKNLATSGARLLVYGHPPTTQPSFLNFKENDEKTKKLIQTAIDQPNTTNIKKPDSLSIWLNQLPIKIKFPNKYNFTRSTERQMSDGSVIKFIWNQSYKEQQIAIASKGNFKHFYWLNAENGILFKNKSDSIVYIIPPYGSIFLLCSNRALPGKILSPAPVSFRNKKQIINLDKWTIKIGDTLFSGSILFDLRTNDKTKYNSDKATYNTSFVLPKKESKRKYLIDLGSTYFTAEIRINGRMAGKRIWAPYQMDITSMLKTGNNAIEILVTSTNRNKFIGEAISENKKYNQFRRKENTLMPAGLLGPVSIYKYKDQY